MRNRIFRHIAALTGTLVVCMWLAWFARPAQAGPCYGESQCNEGCPDRCNPTICPETACSCMNCADCDDCTNDWCENGVCHNDLIPGCPPPWLEVEPTEVCVGCTIRVTVNTPPLSCWADPPYNCSEYELMFGAFGPLAADSGCDPDLLPASEQQGSPADCCNLTSNPPGYCVERWHHRMCADPDYCNCEYMWMTCDYLSYLRCEGPFTWTKSHFKLGENSSREFDVRADTCGEHLSAASLMINVPYLSAIYSPCNVTVKDRLMPPMVFKPESLTPCSPVTATVYSGCGLATGFQWTSPQEGDGIILTPSGSTCLISIDPKADLEKLKTKSITVTAEITSANPPGYCGATSLTGILPLGNKGCSAGSCGIGGDGGTDNGCVNVWITLGPDKFGGNGGYLYLVQETPTAVAASHLTYALASSTTVVQTSRGGKQIKQIKVPGGVLAEIVADNLNSGTFTVDFYTHLAAGSPNTNGVYTPSGDPYRRWKFDDPDGVGGVDLRVNDNYKEEYQQYDAALKSEFTYQTANGVGWKVVQRDHQGSALRTITRFSTGTNPVTETYEVKQGQGGAGDPTVEKRDKVYDGNGKLTQSTAYADASTTLVTNYFHLANGVEARESSDGSWEINQYDGSMRKLLTISAYLDAEMPGLDPLPNPLPQNVGRVFVYDYTTLGYGDDPNVHPQDPRTVTEKINGVVVSKTYYAYYNSSGCEVAVTEQDPNPTDSSGYYATGNLRTEVWSFQGDYVSPHRTGKPYRVYHPDGTMEEYSYDRVNYEEGENHTPGTFAGTGNFTRTLVRRGRGYFGGGLIQEDLRSTSTMTITDPLGRVVLEETYVYTTSADERIAWTVREHDEQGRPTGAYYHNNTKETMSYDAGTCCGSWTTTNADGITTIFRLDAFRRVHEQIKSGVSAVWDNDYLCNAQPEITTTYAYDPVGRVLSTTTTAGTGGDAKSQTTSTTYDWLGRPKVATDTAGVHTGYAYDYLVGGGRRTTVSRYGNVDPGTGEFVPISGVTVTEITDHYPDGRTWSVTGTGTVQKSYEYGVATLGSVYCQWTKVLSGPTGGNRPWSKAWIGPLGRTVCEDRPAYEDTPSGAFLSTLSIYNNKGQLVRTEYVHGGTTTKYLADTVYEYDNLGNQIRSGMDLNGNQVLDDNSTDRIQENETVYEKGASPNQYWWQVSRSYVHARNNAASKILSGTQKRRLTGFGYQMTDQSISIDTDNNQTVSTTSHTTMSDGSLKVYQYTQVPNADYCQASTTRNGLLQCTYSTSGLKTTFAYDALGRRTQVKEQRHTSDPVTIYHATTGQVTSVIDPGGSVTSYAYYADTGLLYSVTRTFDSQSIVQYFAYDGQGRQTHVWGNATYPVQYGYDAYGRRTTMKTYRGGTGWNDPNLQNVPFGTEEPEVTTWGYDEATGLLKSKTDDASKAVTYTYYPDGKLYTRTWARGVTTTYNYSPTTREMTGIDYSGTDTPDVTFSYTRLGRHYQITDGVGTRTFEYDDGGKEEGYTLHLTYEGISGTNGFYTRTITRDYEGTGTGEVPGRDAGFHVGYEWDPQYEAHYSYTDVTGPGVAATGRFNRVTGTGLPAYGVLYHYELNSDLIAYSYFDTVGDETFAPAMVERNYEESRDLVYRIVNIYGDKGGAELAKYTYYNDPLGRRKAVNMSGEGYGTPTFNSWAYNSKSELESSRRYTGVYTPTPPPENEIVAERRLYNYDHIGNRLDSTEGTGTPKTYTANDLNQYTGLTNPPEYLCYDDDGNLKREGKLSTECPGTDGLREFKWDAENRLIEVVPISLSNGVKKVKFAYDYMGRRVRKDVFIYADGWPTEPNQREQYLYDGWNVFMVLNGSHVTMRTYIWGLDLSRSIHGAGGIGGLLAAVETQGTPVETDDETYWFFYDANGNVSDILDATDSEDLFVAAHYEYDPYGNVINNLGSYTYAAENPIRFSTKWFDDETSLGYWGYRHYSPRLGRWISRDPEAERGGLNLYAFVNNGPQDRSDPQGLCPHGATMWAADKYACIGLAMNPNAMDVVNDLTMAWYIPTPMIPLRGILPLYTQVASLASGCFSGFRLWIHYQTWECQYWGLTLWTYWEPTTDYWFDTCLGDYAAGRTRVFNTLEGCVEQAKELMTATSGG